MAPHHAPALIPSTPATLADVAERADVSVSTASRALSGTRRVSDRTNQRVHAAALALDYQPNAVASALRSRRTQTVGLILPRYATAFLSSLIESTSEALDHAGMGLLLRYVAPDGSDHDARVGDLVQRRVDGMILSPPTLDASRRAAALAHGIPLVQVGRFADEDCPAVVSLDEQYATTALAAHLHERGTTRVFLVGLDPLAPADARRADLLRIALARHAITLFDTEFRGADLAGGMAAGDALRGALAPDDTVVGANDDVALGVLAILRASGIAVPGDVQLASLTELYPESSGERVTALRHPWKQMGAEAADLLARATSSPSSARRHTQLDARLIPGTTTRPHASETP